MGDEQTRSTYQGKIMATLKLPVLPLHVYRYRSLRRGAESLTQEIDAKAVTAKLHFAAFAAFSTAFSCGLRASASAPLPVSMSVNSLAMSKPSAWANA